MDLKEIGNNTRNWIDSAQDSPCECGFEPPGSISHGVRYTTITNIERAGVLVFDCYPTVYIFLRGTPESLQRVHLCPLEFSDTYFTVAAQRPIFIFGLIFLKESENLRFGTYSLKFLRRRKESRDLNRV